MEMELRKFNKTKKGQEGALDVYTYDRYEELVDTLVGYSGIMTLELGVTLVRIGFLLSL